MMEVINNIAIIFMAIFLEALPFLILGSIISAIIERYVSENTITKLIPKNVFLGSIVGIFLGFFIPACDCAVIPISKRLIKKKVPLNVSVSFMLSSPIINPVVLLSTYYAFYKTMPQLFWLRLILGIIVSLVIGIIIGIIFKNKKVIKETLHEHNHTCHCEHDNNELVLECGDLKEEKGIKKNDKNFFNDIIFIIKHAAYDMFDVLKYLMIGALFASLIQTLLPTSILSIFKNNKILTIIILMLFAYFMSLCSTSDSFVGKSLLSSFNSSGILAYLLLGPMIDIKNTIVLLGNYKKSFVITLIILIFIVIFISTLLMGVYL